MFIWDCISFVIIRTIFFWNFFYLLNFFSLFLDANTFHQLVKGIGESKSKQEEDTIILNEIQVLKKRMAEKNVDAARV